MVINTKILKVVLWFVVVTLVALSFPLQVYTGNPYPSLIPYVLIIPIFILEVVGKKGNGVSLKALLPSNYIGLVIKIYLLLVILQAFFQTVLGLISVYEGVSSFIIYLLPVAFYCYFRQIASRIEIRTVMIAIVTSSLVVGFYFAYDSYVKLALHQVTDYSIRAFEYSNIRADSQAGGDLNDARIAIGYRSFGLLESHSVSGGWVVIGAIALLALIARSRKILRLVIVFIFAVLLLLGLNFTAIVAYFFVIFLFELGGVSIFRLRFSISLLINIAVCAVLLFVLALIPKLIVGEVMAEFITNNLLGQKELALGSSSAQDLSMIRIILNNFNGYFAHVLEMPHTLFFGDGFSTFGMTKGGDIGFVESMAKFGMPFFIFIVIGLVRLVDKSLRKIRALKISGSSNTVGMDRINLLQFAVSFTVMIFISELHYTIWSAKSVLPIFFFAIALFDRHLYLQESSEAVPISKTIKR